MIDSHFANTTPSSQTPAQRTPSSPAFKHFCLGAALGLLVGALCGAYLPDRAMGIGVRTTGAHVNPPSSFTLPAPDVDPRSNAIPNLEATAHEPL